MTNPNLSPQFGSPEYHRQVSSGTHPPAMIATAPEIVQTHHLNDIEGGRSAHTFSERLEYGDGWEVPFRNKEDLMSYKEKDRPHLTEDIKGQGFNWKEPVQAGHIGYLHELKDSISLVDGHHRLAAMYYHRPDEFLPIQTTEYGGKPQKPSSGSTSDHLS
jgi:hypothetical protein